MGHTNSTANLSLPQFIGTDKPTWLGDVNGAFSAIDSYAGTNDAAVAAAVSDASSAISQAAAAVNTANTANTTAGNASTAANNAIGVANTANAIAGTVDAKVGLLADLTTTDRTSIVNAINEVNGKDAGDIAYDNSGSGLTATNVQAAIDEVAQGGGGGHTVLKTVTADGVKTYGQIFGEFLSEVANINDFSIFVIDDGAGYKRICQLVATNGSDNMEFAFNRGRVAGYDGYDCQITASPAFLRTTSGSTADNTTSVPTSGMVFTLYA
jgi:hypothetical protein